MKTTKLFVHLSSGFCVWLSAQAQGDLQNLNFEAANLPVIPAGQYGGEVPVSSALPGWTVYLGSSQQTQVLHNYAYNSTATVDILGPNWQEGHGYTFEIIDGQYSVFLQSGNDPNNIALLDNASIAQTGTVPANAESLQFKAWQLYVGTFSVTFNGNSLSPVALSSGQSPSGQPYTVYGADIAAYAGETGQLEFTQLYNGADPALLLDDITFSPNAIPEPSPLALILMGGLALAARRWRGKGW
ncbi:MAG: PEP-CTERM sorting domain-containing protein [Verrucomicrobiota bacterium]|jgi:hypothetical protein